MNWHSIFAVWKKEMLEAVRDKRTLIATLVIPTVVVPLILLIAGMIMSKVVGKAQRELAQIMVVGGEHSPKIMAVFNNKKRFKLQKPESDWRRRIADKQIRAVLVIPDDFDSQLERGDFAQTKIYHYEGEMRSGFAVGEVRRALNEYREQQVTQQLKAKGLPASLVKPFDIKAENVAPAEKVGGNAIGGIIPYMFLIFCFTGALYPAIDITAGEKERGTLETILCSPVKRIELVLGKFLMVLSASLTTVVCSILSMGGTILVGGAWLMTQNKGMPTLGGDGSGMQALISPLGMLAVVALTIPLAAVFSALLLAISLAAKTSKEAQSYTTPLMMLVILPAMMGMLPGVELNAALSFVPVLNTALVSKELLSGVWNWGYLALIFGSSCLYAAASLAFCVRQFNRESVLFR